MKIEKVLRRFLTVRTFVLGVFLVAGCKSTDSSKCDDMMCCSDTNAVAKVAPILATPPMPPMAAPVAEASPLPPVHIKAGPGESFTDADGNVWITDRGFPDGDSSERPELTITNTKTQKLYQSERYSMSAFLYPVPNGKYLVKLHFAETYEEIHNPGERVFSMNVEGTEFKDFDVVAKAGGPLKAYIETVPVEVTDGKVDITFTPKEQNPEINGIEILPEP